MKNKFTIVIMILIIISIIGVIGILGFSIVSEFTSFQDNDSKQASANANTTNSNNVEKKEVDIENTIEKNIEVPKIQVNESSNNNALEELANGANASNTNIASKTNFDNVTVNKYFYNQLPSYSQTIYKAFESNKQNMKSGNYKINFGDAFSSVLSNLNGQDQVGNYYQSAIEAYMYDNPDLFYLSPNKMYFNIETTTRGSTKTYNTFITCGDNANYFVDEFSSSSEVNSALSQLESIRQQVISRRTGDKYTDIKMAHDYLINSIDYDNTLSQRNIYNIYGALVNKTCVCEGYAKAFKYLLDGMGIENTLVIGTGINTDGQSENHAWNYVNLNGIWYAVDCTWDDPIIIGNGYVSENIKYKYFLKGSNTFNVNHFPSGRFSEDGMVFSYPTLSSTDY